MKVLHIVSDLGQGGAQSYVCDLLKCHQQMGGIESEVFALFFKGPLWERIERLGIPIECLELRNALDIGGIIRLYKRLMLSDHDIIQVHAIHPAVSAFVGRLHTKNIYMEHGGRLLAGSWKDKLIYWLLHKNYCRFVAISHHMKNVMRAANPSVAGKIRVIHNGTDIERIDATPVSKADNHPYILNNNYFRVGIVGRLVRQKGITTFLHVAENLLSRRNDVIFPVIGDGPLLSELEDEAAHLGIRNRVIFLGFRIDAIRLLKQFDIFLFTSDSEGFGLAIIEAMAAGIPVVALHQQTAVTEIIDDGIDGYVVHQKDPVLLADRVCVLLDDHALRERFSRKARQKVKERFTMKINAQKVYELYRECLEKY